MSSAIQELTNFISARVPLIWVTTHEENRFLSEFTQSVVSPLKLSFSIWSQTSGLKTITRTNKTETFSGTQAPLTALQKIDSLPEANYQQVFVMRDLFLNPLEVRYLRDMYEDLADSGKTIIILSPFLAHNPGGIKEGIPPTLEKQMCVVEYSLPSFEDIVQIVRKSISSLGSKEYTEQEIEEFARSLSGLTSIEIDNATTTCVAEYKQLNNEHLLAFKKQSIRKSQVLEFMETDVDIDSVGGLDRVKEYFNRYKNCFDSSAVEFGVEAPKLLILLGICGTGKSYISKSIGNLFKLPLIQLDMGRIYGSLVGQSEQRVRSAISTLESNAPCLCLVDEVEKGISGTHSSSQSDGGTTSRVFGTLLTALQDGLKDVIFITTCNEIRNIPPEFIRRANEVFFVDLPGPDERWDILRIHLEKRKRKISWFSNIKDDFLLASEGYTGAEIEKAVKDAIARAFYDSSEEVTSSHILAALSETKPISQVMETQIKELQEWARNHARYASSYSEQKNKVIPVENNVESKRMKKLRSLN